MYETINPEKEIKFIDFAIDIIGQVPHALAIQVIPPRIWFPLMTLIWAGLTMCSAATHNFSQLAAVRFFQGMIEASTYSGTQYVIGSWYKSHEIGKRIGLFAASGMAGTMFAGKPTVSQSTMTIYFLYPRA
jgi:ACS family pantothenate transporter-like MFS transporter